MSYKKTNVILRCPICNESLVIDISSISFKLDKDVFKLTIVHGSPPHTILAYINRNGEVVGVEAIKQTVFYEAKIEEPVVVKVLSIKEIAELFGSENIAYILSAIKKGKPVYFLSGKKIDWALEIATSISIELNLNITINVNKLGNLAGFYVIDEEFYKENAPEIEKNLIFSTTGGLFGQIPKLDKKVLDSIRRIIGEKKGKEDLSDIFF